jgi:hypothetical protein
MACLSALHFQKPEPEKIGSGFFSRLEQNELLPPVIITVIRPVVNVPIAAGMSFLAVVIPVVTVMVPGITVMPAASSLFPPAMVVPAMTAILITDTFTLWKEDTW